MASSLFPSQHFFTCVFFASSRETAALYNTDTLDRYTAPKFKRLSHTVLVTPEEIQEHIPSLLKLRESHGIRKRQDITWEPFPASCTTINRPSVVDACKLFDVFSPNHLDLLALFEGVPSGKSCLEKLEKCAQELKGVDGDTTSKFALDFRVGESGSLTVFRPEKPLWLPLFYKSNYPRVVDPTGAGNTFLGGFVAGWHQTGDLEEASAYGHVTASFVVEQIGLPTLHRVKVPESWNNVEVSDRLEEYGARITMLDD